MSDGPVCLITGARSGVGAATAKAFAAIGARSALLDRAAPDPALTAALAAAGGSSFDIVLDVRDAAALRAAADEAVDRFGRLDVIVACAGIADQSDVSTGDPDRWRDVVETNLLGAMYTVRAGLPMLRAQGRGHVFVVASVSGRESYVGEPVYIASKWGQVGFVHSLRQEVMEDGVRVTVVEPGLIDTPLVRGNPKVAHLLDGIDALRPEDVAEAIVHAYRQPDHVVVSEITLRPLRQQLPDLRQQDS